MIRCINTYRRKSPDGLVLNVYQGSFFYSDEAPCTDLLSSAIATKYTGKPSEFWNTNQDTSFINYRGFTKSHLETTFDQKTAIEQLFIDLQETFCHYQKNVATNLYELNNVYVAANFKHFRYKGIEEAPQELFMLVQAFLYLQDHNHYPEYVKPIIYKYLGSKMLEG